MSEMPYSITDALRSAMWSVDHQAVRIFRLDDPVKVKRAVRAYRQAADNLLAVAHAEREARQAARPAPAGPGAPEGEAGA
jgi:hypothetical protein